MDITALSTSLANINLSQQVGVSLLSMGKDLMEQQGQSFEELIATVNPSTQVIERSVTPHLGGCVDIKV